MPAGIGYQFAPGADANVPPDQGQGGQASGLSPQAAVKLLQLRVPERPAAGGIAPQSLLTGQGGQGMGGLQAIIQMLMRRGVPGLQGGGMQVPSPHITPGVQPRQSGPIQGPYDISPEMIEQAMDMDLGGGRTLRKGGGVLGNWRGQGGADVQPAPPLF